MVRIDKFINDKDIKMILSIHDELVFEVANSCMHYVKDIQSIMESSYKSKNGIVLKTEASISKTSLAKKDMIKYEHN
jgi:DNA polymerase I-like protein with 3'-5' exonuclease and polymerase domains